MGKRKLHGDHSFFLCDWTGIPMDKTYAYLPSYTPEGDDCWKLTKKGSYCNWEAALAHCRWLVWQELTKNPDESVGGNMATAPYNCWEHVVNDCTIPKWYQKAEAHIIAMSGPDIVAAPMFDMLRHFKGPISAEEFGEVCAKQTGEVVAIQIPASGEPHEILVDCSGENKDPSIYINRGYSGPLAHLTPLRKGKEAREKDLKVYYNPHENQRPNPLTFNQTATAIFKMEIFGDCVMIQTSKELSYFPKERYINYTLQDFEDMYSKRKKRTETPTVLRADEYKAVKREMQASLNEYELKKAAPAEAPQKMAKTRKCPPADGKELAELARQREAGKAMKKASKVARRQLEASLAASSKAVDVQTSYVAPEEDFPLPPQVVRQSAMAVAGVVV